MTEESTAPARARKRWIAPAVFVVAVVAVIIAAVESMQGSFSNDRAGGEQACIEEGSGEVVDSRYDDGEIFTVGQGDDGGTWTCDGTYNDDRWVVFVRPGG